MRLPIRFESESGVYPMYEAGPGWCSYKAENAFIPILEIRDGLMFPTFPTGHVCSLRKGLIVYREPGSVLTELVPVYSEDEE